MRIRAETSTYVVPEARMRKRLVALDVADLVRGGAQAAEADLRRQLHVELARRIDLDLHRQRSAGQHVPAATPLGVDEVEVVARHLEAARVVWEAEADHRPAHVLELEHVLLVSDLAQGAVGWALAGHRAGAHELELPVDAHGATRRVATKPRKESVMVEGPLDPERLSRLEERDHREGRASLRRNVADHAVGVGAHEAAVHGDHLAVEGVQGSDPEVAVTGQLGEGQVALEPAGEERVERGGLEEGVGLVLRVGACPRAGLDVQQPVIDQIAGVRLHRRRAAGSRFGLIQPVSAGLTFVPGGTISSMRSRTSSERVTSAPGSCDSRCSIVRGPMIAAVTAGWRITKASAISIRVMPASSARAARASAASSLR